MEITLCTKVDYDQIITDMDDFWNSSHIDNLRRQHNPIYFYEFGNTAFVVKEGEEVIGYLFGLCSQTSPTAYVKFVGVRASHRKRGVGRALYEYFTMIAKEQGYNELKAITSPNNKISIAFHQSLGMELLGEPNENGIPVMKDYAGPGNDRMVFRKYI
ncbi:MAG: GNAT family N-acetyltransferase [Dehalococcoidales bacterium]|nr:MAG: GNAT family N-acetyltransferase [Dehalococcoidales bacterium]